MASAAGTPAGGAPAGRNSAPQQYFCYQCERMVSITPSPSADLACPLCAGGFLEEYENSNPNPNPDPDPDPFPAFADPFSTFLGGLPFLMSSSAGPEFQNPRNFSISFPPESQTPPPGGFPQDPNAFNPIVFLQNYLQSMREGGANIQVVFENHPSDPGFRLPSNLGDYFIGPGLEQLIQQLAENDPNRYGTPPASKSAIERLPDIPVSDELLASDLSQCAVCMNDFEHGMKVKQMPCKHIYHSDCILPWLELHNSCPVCRHELPTDDPDYENRPQGARGPGVLNVASGGGPQENAAQGQRTPERRFMISLPWPFGAFGSRAESSQGGATNNGGGSNTEGSNPSGRQNWNSGSESRQEDLD